MQEVKERAYQALKLSEGMTPVNQWHEKILEQAKSEPISEIHWNQQPECIVYDWPENENGN